MMLRSNQANAPMDNDAEKRKYQRLEKPVIIRFRIRPNNDQEMASSGWDMVGVNDLSAGGLFFNSSNNIQNGSILDLKIGFATSSVPVRCTGMVTRVIQHTHTHTSIFGIAAAFMEIDNEEKELIDTFVNKTLRSYLTANN